MARDRDTDVFKGMAFIEFENVDALASALLLDGSMLGNGTIRVEVAAASKGSDRSGSGRRSSLPGRLSRSGSVDGGRGGLGGLLPYPPSAGGLPSPGGILGSNNSGSGGGGSGLSSPSGFSLLADGMNPLLNSRSPRGSLRSNTAGDGGGGTGSMRSLGAALAAAADEATWGGDAESSKGRPKLNLQKRTTTAPVGGRAEGSNPYLDASPRRQSSGGGGGGGVPDA